MHKTLERREYLVNKLRSLDKEKIFNIVNEVDESTTYANDDGIIALWQNYKIHRCITLKDNGIDSFFKPYNGFVFSIQYSWNYQNFGQKYSDDECDEIKIYSNYNKMAISTIKDIYEIYKKHLILNVSISEIRKLCYTIHKKYWNRKYDRNRIDRIKTKNEKKCILNQRKRYKNKMR